MAVSTKSDSWMWPSGPVTAVTDGQSPGQTQTSDASHAAPTRLSFFTSIVALIHLVVLFSCVFN